MSLHESWRTRLFWEKAGGMLIEEFVVVRRSKHIARRLIDAVIVLNEKKQLYSNNEYNISGKDVIVIQTKSGRLGMYLLGQAYFSKVLIKQHNPKSIRVVVICGKSDLAMEELALQENIEVIVIPEQDKI
jgi:hypothetical protein